MDKKTVIEYLKCFFLPQMWGADELAHGRCILPRLWVYRDTAGGFAANRFNKHRCADSD